MTLSTHYYVLSLGEHTTRLYEAFRDSLIDIQNTWFPLESSMDPLQPTLDDAQLRTLLETVDHHFAHYHAQEPLGMVLAGTERDVAMFASLTAHTGVLIGKAPGDHSITSLIELGGIVWPIVKEAMASAGNQATPRAHNVSTGIDSVGHSADSGVGATLLVEDGYLVKPQNLSLVDDGDNVVDGIVERVLALGGNVIFAADGSLSRFQRIALIQPV